MHSHPPTPSSKQGIIDAFWPGRPIRLSPKATLWLILLLFLALRLAAMWTLPFFDTTEARYGEMARKMVETGRWLAPQFDYDVPFWGKPPLHTWLSAAGVQIFGVSEFAARLPILIVSLCILVLIYQWLAPTQGRRIAVLSLVVLASTVLFFGASAFVMTDMPMVLGTTLVMISVWQAANAPRMRNHHAILVGLGLSIGMLAKGPVALVICAIPTLGWLATRRQLGLLAHPEWLWGLAMFLIGTLPWYIAAEIATPGFLRYFLIGEHIERFLVPGWEGDLYGHGHEEPKGMIWLFFLGASLPWSLFLLPFIWRPRRVMQAFRTDHRGFLSYLLAWMLSPLLLFTPAANILPAYVLPGLPAAAILLVLLWDRDMPLGPTRLAGGLSIACTATFFAGLTVLPLIAPDSARLRSHARAIEIAQTVAPAAPVYTFNGRVYSAEFYTQGQARPVAAEDVARLARPALLIAHRNLKAHPILSAYRPQAETGRYVVYHLTQQGKGQ